MENRPLSVAAGLIALVLMVGTGQAAEVDSESALEADWRARLAKAAEMHAESKARLDAADSVQAESDARCPTRFLVNSCFEDSRRTYMQAARPARSLENEAKAIERLVRKEQLQEQERRQRELAAQHAGELTIREKNSAEESHEVARRQAAKIADQARRGEEGARRKAAEAEKQRQKQAAHAARVAEKTPSAVPLESGK